MKSYIQKQPMVNAGINASMRDMNIREIYQINYRKGIPIFILKLTNIILESCVEG